MGTLSRKDLASFASPGGSAAVAAAFNKTTCDVFTAAAVLAARQRIINSGLPGTVVLKPGFYDFTDGTEIQLVDGVSYVCEQLPQKTDINRVPDSVRDFTAGCVFVGNGSNRAFWFNDTDTVGVPPTVFQPLRGVTLYGIGFKSFKNAVSIGAYNSIGAVDCVFDQLHAVQTTDWAFRYLNCMAVHFGKHRMGDCAGQIMQGNSMDLSYLQAGNNTADDWAAVIVSPSSAKANRTTKGFWLGCFGAASQMQGVSTYGRIQCNFFGRVELTATATITSGSANIVVPDATEFPLGMPVAFGANVGSKFVAGNVYFVVSNDGATTIQLAVSPSWDALVPDASATPTIKTKGHAPLMVIGRNSLGLTVAMDGVTFNGLDLEGITSCGAVFEQCGNVNVLDIQALPAYANCYKQVVAEQCKRGPTIFGSGPMSLQQSSSYGVKLIGITLDRGNSYINANNLQWPMGMWMNSATNAPELNISASNRAGVPTFADNYFAVSGGGVSAVTVGAPIGRYLNSSTTVQYGITGGIGTAVFNDSGARSITYPTYTAAVHGIDQINAHNGLQSSGSIITINADGSYTFGLAGDGRTQVKLKPGQFFNTIFDNQRGMHAVVSHNVPTFLDSSGTPGSVTQNTWQGRVAAAASATSLVVTNALCTPDSIVTAVIATADATAAIKSVVPGNGSFTINLTAPTAQTNINWVLHR